VYSVERHRKLAREARARFQELGYENIHVRHGDGSLGWPEHAPYKAIVVTAAAPDIPDPLREQLAVGGRLVIPAGETRLHQTLLRVRRTAEDRYEQENLGAVRFVPLIGQEGW
jgi:protein-L-isoaspartate(D-aspartate) O-methyltransferase